MPAGQSFNEFTFDGLDPAGAESILTELTSIFFPVSTAGDTISSVPDPSPDMEARYKVLLDQLPAVVFMAYLDQGMGEAYVSPQIEAALGFSQREWLEDPVRWYRQIHPEDKERWSIEAAGMFLSGKPLSSSYRVMARDGRVVWFHCEARLVRRVDGRPWFIHGVGFDITGLKEAEQALQKERNVVTAILNTVGALVVVLDQQGRIVRFNRACEQTTGYSFAEVEGKRVAEMFLVPEEADRFEANFTQLCRGILTSDYESQWLTRSGVLRLISWSNTVLTDGDQVTHIIATGIDITDRKELERAVLAIGTREQRRIGQDLHDGLGQRLTGIAFMAKVLEQRLAEASLPEATEAARIVQLVNDSIRMTRELAHGLLPVVSESRGLMSALERWASEVSDVFHLDCRFECPSTVLISDEMLAEHVYHMAQESVNNAVKHARPHSVTIGLTEVNRIGMLTVRDDGLGFNMSSGTPSGLGLRIMYYRAKMIGGSLYLQSAPGKGTLVSCSFPIGERRPGGPNAS